MAEEAYIVSPDGARGQYMHLENRTVQDAIDHLRDQWGTTPVVVVDRSAMKRAVRTPGPPDDSLLVD